MSNFEVLDSKRKMLFFDELTPQSRSSRMLIKMLNAEVEERPVDLLKGQHMDPKYHAINPMHTVPALLHEGQLYTGNAILIYLCEQDKSRVSRSLYPEDMQRRMDIMNKLFFDSSIIFRRYGEFLSELLRKTYGGLDMQLHRKKIWQIYDITNGFLKDKRSYMAGDELTIADVAIVGTLSGLDVIFPLDAGKGRWSKLNSWLCNMSTFVGYQHVNDGVEKERALAEGVGQLPVLSCNQCPRTPNCGSHVLDAETIAALREIQSLTLPMSDEQYAGMTEQETNMIRKCSRPQVHNCEFDESEDENADVSVKEPEPMPIINRAPQNTKPIKEENIVETAKIVEPAVTAVPEPAPAPIPDPVPDSAPVPVPTSAPVPTPEPAPTVAAEPTSTADSVSGNSYPTASIVMRRSTDDKRQNSCKRDTCRLRDSHLAQHPKILNNQNTQNGNPKE